MPPGSFDTPDRLADANKIVDAVREFIVSRSLIRRQGLVLAAASGGADSMALLSILHRLSRDLGFSLAVGHFNHQIRASAQKDLEAVRDFAESLGLPFHSGTEDVRSIAEATGDTLEEAARKARYRFLHGIAEETRADHIATGHTRDDQVETVLMRILRGTGIRGLAGIPVRRGKVVRPLLGLAREQTVAYCRASGVPFVEDATNTDLRFPRNRIRHTLLPLLESTYNPAVRESLARMADNAGTILETIRAGTAPLLEKNLVRDAPNRWILSTDGMDRLDDTAIVVLFGDVFADELSCDMDFTRVHYDELVRLVRDRLATGKSVSLPGLHVRKEHNGLVISRPTPGGSEVSPPTAEAVLALPGDTATAGLIVTTDILDRTVADARGFRASETEAYFDRARISPPLTLRTTFPGDRIQPFGMPGTKKLSDIFTDRKIPASARTTSLVITDAHDILWLVGITTSEKCRVGAGTRDVVRIRIRRT
jgi:tRNA(Ile)-lysidine synthase